MPHDDLTPDEEQVRRLLADARHDEPVPDDVAARLDEVLAGLAEDSVPPQRTWPSADELAAARRRRTVRGWLVAAAAVVVLGVGINQVDWSGLTAGSGDDSASDAGGDSVAAEADGGAREEAPADQDGRDLASWRAARLVLSADRFGEQVEEFRKGKGDDFGRLLGSIPTSDLFESDAQAYSAVCDVGDLGAGRVVPVRYDGARAWLVFRKSEGDTQVVDLYLCGSTEPTRSITLPAP